jgi:deoxyadenosine/deoxycytidine kinase
METKKLQPRPIIISIEGCIGAGKTTVIEALKTKFGDDIQFIDEPVKMWQSLKNEQGNDLLQVFYEDNKRYSYTFQNCALLTRAIMIQKCIDDWLATSPTKNKIFITERSLPTDYNVFAKMLRDDGMMDKMEWDLYKMWYEHIEKTSAQLTGIIYLVVDYNTCKQRIEKRNRAGEDKISLEYLKKLIKYQNEWLLSDKNDLPKLLILTDVDDKVEHISKFVKDILMNDNRASIVN